MMCDGKADKSLARFDSKKSINVFVVFNSAYLFCTP